jgi:hypothetical protein
MLLLLTVNMIAECPRTDCNRLGDVKTKGRESVVKISKQKINP